MKTRITGLVWAVFFAAGCDQYLSATEPPEVNTWMVQTVHDAQVENAVIRQQTLFPYHFVVNGADLNGLGKSDLAILAEHYRLYPGKLSVRKGDASKTLYEARLATVREAMKDAGVEIAKVEFTDSVAGGDGLSGREVLLIIEKAKKTFETDRPRNDYMNSSAGAQQ